MKTNKNIFKIMTISIVTLLLFNCSDDIQEDNALSESLNLQEEDLSTVPLESTLDFFNSLNTTNRLSSARGDQNNIGLEIDIASLEQVDISDTDAKLNIANATTKFDNVETQILQIEIDGTLQTVLFHHIPEDTTASNRNSARAAAFSFTGSVFTTNLSGIVLSGFKINSGNIFGSFNFKTPIYNTDPDPCWGIGCGIDLDEVVIMPPSPSNYAAVNHTTMNNRAYQWGRSSNNYSSMGTAFANYYNQKAVSDFAEEDVWNKEDPYSDWNDLTECEKTFFKSNPNLLWSAKSNKSRAQNAAKDRFGNCTPTHPLRDTIGDAYRHAYFSALNARNSSFGYTKAVMLGYAHECETPNNQLNAKDMDLHNNNWGFNYSKSNQQFSEAEFYTAFMNAYNKNEINILKPCN